LRGEKDRRKRRFENVLVKKHPWLCLALRTIGTIMEKERARLKKRDGKSGLNQKRKHHGASTYLIELANKRWGRNAARKEKGRGSMARDKTAVQRLPREERHKRKKKAKKRSADWLVRSRRNGVSV